MLGEDDELALAPTGILHVGIILEHAGEFIPFAVLPRSDEGSGL